MAEIRTVTTLRRKRVEVRKAVRKCERCLDQARADLTHLIAAIARQSATEQKHHNDDHHYHAEAPTIAMKWRTHIEATPTEKENQNTGWDAKQNHR